MNLRCLNPVSQNTYVLADIVTLMDRNLSMVVVPMLKSTGQEYFVYNVDRTIVNGQSAYTFPERAIGNALRDVVLVDASGNEVALNNLMREYIKVLFPFNFVPSIWSFGQYMTGDSVNLYNTMIQTYTAYSLRFITERRPGGLTLTSNCGQITAVTGNVLTLSNVDATWTTSDLFDIINQKPPFQSIGDDLAVTDITGSQVTLSSVPSNIAVGQWFCPAGLSCLPQIPYDMFALLEELTVATLAEGLEMTQLAATAAKNIENWTNNALKLARPRIKGSTRVIINKDAVNRGWNGQGGGWR